METVGTGVDLLFRLYLRGPCPGTGRRFRGPAPTRSVVWHRV